MLDKKEGREISLKFLFCQEFADEHKEVPTQVKINQFRNSFKASDKAWLTAERIIDCVFDKKDVIDETFKGFLKNWSMERISLTDKNILRIGTAEIMFLDIPHQIAIDEALNLSKRFSTKESTAFINAVLDAVSKKEGTATSEKP